VLITSRFTAWSKGIATYPVWVLEPGPARELLLLRSGRAGTGEAAAADEVAQVVGYLPLALEQAAAYVAEQTGYGFAEYLRDYREKGKDFLARKERGATNYPDSVYLTWRMTVDRLPDGARAMLRLHAFFAPTPFPVSLYVAGAAKLREEALPEEMGAEAVPDKHAVREWKSSLVRYSMARAEPGDCISVHALVQAVERHAMGARAGEVARRAAEMYLRAKPKPSWDLVSRELWAGLVSHSRALAECEFVGDVMRGNLHAELLWVFLHAGNYTEGVAAGRRALEARERVLGPEHPDTLKSVNNLAALLRSQGDYGAAEPLYRRALEAQERVLGAEHPDTLRSVNNLAVLLYSKGDYGAAEPLYRRALEAQERVLGAEHPDTLRSVNNLALLLYSKGDYGAAEPLYRRALEAWERVLGAEHPDTLTSVNNLALLLDSKGEYGAAEPLFRRAAEGLAKVLGPKHPRTRTGAANHQRCLDAMGGLPDKRRRH
jgi:tetratricopeptide (TPR) repeat protein